MNKPNKFFYGLASIGTNLSYQSFVAQIQYFYVAQLGISSALIGSGWLLYGVWNAVNDPLMGRLSDGTRSKLGRRIPYILFGAVPLAIFYALLWTPPQQLAATLTQQFTLNIPGVPDPVVITQGHLLMAGYFLIIVFAFDTLWSLVVIAWTALLPEMWSDLRERAEVAGLREVFTLIGVLVGLGLSPQVISWVGYRGMGILFGVITAVTFLVSLLGSKENPALHQDEESISLWESLRTSFAIPSFRWFLLANFGKEFVFLTMAAMVPFYARYVLDAQDQQSLLLGTPFILSIPGLFVWTKIAQRVGSRRAWTYASLALIPGLLILLVAPIFNIAMVGSVVLVAGFPGLLMLYTLLISDVIDEDELIGGHRREGFFFGMNGVVIRLAFVLQGLLFAIIPTLTGYNSALDVQPVEAQWGFRFLFAGAPIVAILVSVFALSRYPLHGDTLVAMRSRIEALHRQKEEALGAAD